MCCGDSSPSSGDCPACRLSTGDLAPTALPAWPSSLDETAQPTLMALAGECDLPNSLERPACSSSSGDVIGRAPPSLVGLHILLLA